MPTNPYSITPGGDLRGGLSGLSSILEGVRQQRVEKGKKQAQEEMMQEAQEVFASDDPIAIAKFSVANPQLASAMSDAMGIRSDAQAKDQQSLYIDTLTDPANAEPRLMEHIQRVQGQGGDPSNSLRALETLSQDPEMYATKTAAAFAGQFPKAFNAFMKTQGGGATTAFQTLQERAQASGLKEGTPQYQEFMRYGGAAPKTGGAADQRGRKIEEYQNLFDMSVEDATTAVDSATMMDDKGNLITFDPITGTGSLVDVDTGTERPVIQPPEGVAVEDLAFDPGQGTGFGASFIGLWNSTLGQIPFMPIGEETEMAAQNLRVLERDIVRALASSSRPPVIEQKRLMSLVPEAMSFTQNPEVAKFKMTNVVDLMMNQYVDDKRFMDDRKNPKKVREESASRANEMESIVRRVLTPEAADAMFQSLGKVEAEIGEVRTMSLGDLLDVDPSSLTPSQRDIYIKRLKESM